MRLGLDLRLDIKHLQLYSAIGSEYIKQVSDIRYGKENYDDKANGKVKEQSCERTRRYLIISLEDYNIQ